MPIRRMAILIIIIFIPLSSGIAQCKQPQDAKKHLDQAIEFDSFKNPLAEQEYRKAIEVCGGKYSDALLQLSGYLQRKSRFRESASTLQEYIRQTPKEAHQDDFEELRELQEAATIQSRINTLERPGLTDLIRFYNLISRYSENHLQDAIPYAEKAVALYPTSSGALLLLARALESSKQKDRIFNLIQKAVELTPNNLEAHYEMGRYYLWHSKLERLDDSVNEFRRALDLSDGKAIEAWQGLGRALAFQEKPKEAIAALRNYLRLKKPSQYDNEIRQLIRTLEQAYR